MWHRDFPPDAREMWDVLAKALMIRCGGSIIVSASDLRSAAEMQAEIEIGDEGSISFRVERS